jgi:pimeloyl-ACP methyl ester carboxylesterase
VKNELRRDRLMSDETFERVFSDVPQTTREQVLHFRQTHMPKSKSIDGLVWKYLDSGTSEKTLVVLPGGLRRPDIGWRLFERLERDYRVISPFYPATGSMGVLARGVISILDHEEITRFAIYGSSYGGIVLQSILQVVPERITHAIISNTGTITDDTEFVKLLKRRLRLIQMLPRRIVAWIAKKAFKRMLATIEDDERVVYSALVDEVFQRGWLTKREIICHFEGLADFQLNHRFTPEIASKWDVKLLIIKSSDDPGVVEGASEALDEMYPDAEFHVFLSEDHMPSITRMEEYLSVMFEFLEM